MTDVSTDHPSGLPYIELENNKRKISFRRDCFGTVKIYRKVNEEDWKLLIREVRTPYVDSESFPPDTKLTYTIELEQEGKTHKYQLEARI